MIIKQVPNMDFEKRQALGRAYVAEIDQIISDRHELQDTWRKAHDNYEGKPPKISWPWPEGSSNAFIPITATHTDALYARLYNTATGQDPIYMVELTGSAPAGEFSNEEFVQAWERISKYLEDSPLKLKDSLALALLVATKYGDSILYIPWATKKIRDYDLNPETGEWDVVEERELFGRPKLHVLHPENFYIPLHEHGPDAVQESKFVAYDFEIDYNEIEMMKRSGFYDTEAADALQALLRPDKRPEADSSARYFGDHGDSENMSNRGRVDMDRVRRESVGINTDLPTMRLKMYHVWAREDLDGDGIEEEVNFFVHAGTGIVPHISWNPYKHRKRPFVRYRYKERDGIFYSQGVPELLFNIQDILNQTMRDIMNNNRVQNTKVFLAQKNAGIDPELRVYPSRIIFVNDVNQFVPIDLGSGKQITSVQDLLLMQEWGERRTGISDVNLGQEDTKRTPAATILARLEESNRGIDLIVRRIRESQDETWDQVLALFAQFGFPDGVLENLEGEHAEDLEAAIAEMTVEEVREKVRFRARTSTQNLNRAVRREEALVLFGQLQVFYEQILALANMLAQTDNPVFRELFLVQARGYRTAIARFLNTFDVRDLRNMNPDIESIMASILGGEPIGLPTPGNGSEGSSDQVEQALRSFANGAEGTSLQNVPGRPVAGLPRIPEAGSAISNAAGPVR